MGRFKDLTGIRRHPVAANASRATQFFGADKVSGTDFGHIGGKDRFRFLT